MSALADFEARVSALDAEAVGGGGTGTERVRAIGEALRCLRKSRAHRPDVCVRLGTELFLSPGGATKRRAHSVFGETVWTVYEQVCVAALEMHEMALAEECLTALQRQFPGEKSNRVRLLEGMALEADGALDEAEEIYKELIKENEANALARKRIVAIRKEQGNLQATVTALNEYLATNQADSAAWAELAGLYLQNGFYAQAAFCYEELVLHNPHSVAHHTRLAEVYYTLAMDKGASIHASTKHLLNARKHFCLALEIHRPGNTRAQTGLALTSWALATGRSNRETSAMVDKEVNGALHTLADEDLRRTYAETDRVGDHVGDAVLQVLDELNEDMATDTSS